MPRIKSTALIGTLLYTCFCVSNIYSKDIGKGRKLAVRALVAAERPDSTQHDERYMHKLSGSDNRGDFVAESRQFESFVGRNLTEEQTDDKLRAVTLDDIFISVKTSGKFHRTRLQVILDTWFKKAHKQTFFFSDTDDLEYEEKTGGHLINTGCNRSHIRQDLSCKMGSEYDGFLKSSKKWWCHFDDDNYVNVAQLLKLVRRYDWRDDLYIGRASLSHPFYTTYKQEKVEFWFGTGGAGVCISSALARKMIPWCWNGKLAHTSKELKAPDDCTLGFVINNRLNVNLTQSNLLHSHLEQLSDLKQSTFRRQVSLSYRVSGETRNVVATDLKHARFDEAEDPTRMKSLHCMIAPTDKLCSSTTGSVVA